MFYDPWENSAAFDMIEIKQHKTRNTFWQDLFRHVYYTIIIDCLSVRHFKLTF
jgi:hypothetical protein